MITKNILLSTLMAAGLALPAAAATTSPPDTTAAQNPQSSSAQPATPTSQQISTRLRKSLRDAGFTDIRIMPQSFLVHAKDKDGDPVMMVVNPDSITTVTAMGNGATAGTNSTQHGSLPSGSGTATAPAQPKTTSD